MSLESQTEKKLGRIFKTVKNFQIIMKDNRSQMSEAQIKKTQALSYTGKNRPYDQATPIHMQNENLCLYNNLYVNVYNAFICIH